MDFQWGRAKKGGACVGQLGAHFRELFSQLKQIGYYWEPLTPAELQKRRAHALAVPVTSQDINCYGLGLGANQSSAQTIRSMEPLSPCVSSVGDYFVASDHWPPKSNYEPNFVYFGKESMMLLRQIAAATQGQSLGLLLDLGCASGGLSIGCASQCDAALGIDLNAKAIVWANAIAEAQNLNHLEFMCERVGTVSCDDSIAHWLQQREALTDYHSHAFDTVVFNPSMIASFEEDESKFPHRNGGRWGVEIPQLFLGLAHRYLREGGQVFCLVTNPVVRGQSLFWESFTSEKWTKIEPKILDSRFNHQLYRKERYAQNGVDRVELIYLHLTK